MSDVLRAIIAANRSGAARGIPSWCTAHPQTLSAILATYCEDDDPILIEATCNQVNHEGGYTGMTPADFRAFVAGLAQGAGVDPARIILGGDHLGPNPWKALAAEQAMARARAMVTAYVAAGFTKIHLDASMACADDGRLEEAEMARRAADLCAVAETAAQAAGTRPVYVIGTEVPVPGGETGRLDTLAVTAPTAAARTVELHRAAFAARGLDAALARVVAVVVQPGVDFGNDQVFAYDAARAVDLVAAAPGLGGPLFEAHSTDYQSAAALRGLVAGHFAILKVGPELTFAFRQAAFALDRLARMLADGGTPPGADLPGVLAATMREQPGDWRAYVEPGPREAAMMLYGLSDRVRYYWPRPAVQAALARLFDGLRAARPEPGLVAQVTGRMVGPVDPARLPEAVVAAMVGDVVWRYRRAAGGAVPTAG